MVSVLQKLITSKKRKEIVNEVIRDDVFAVLKAELLFPKSIFKKEMHEKLKEYDHKGPRISAEIILPSLTPHLQKLRLPMHFYDL